MRINFFLFTLLILCLTSCGFHLRGSLFNLGYLNPIYVQSNEPYSEFTQTLSQTLRNSGMTLASSEHQARVVLHILNTQFSQKMQQLSANTQVKIFLLTYTVNYQLKNARGDVIYGPRRVVQTTTYAASDTQLLADSNLLHMQLRRMIRETVNLLFIQLNSNAPRMAVMKHR